MISGAQAMNESNPSNENIRLFWKWFADHQEEVLEIMAGRRQGKVTDRIDKALSDAGLNLTYEVTEGTFGGELTFTPMGDPEMARFIDRFVAAAPSFETWMVHGRRQRKPLKAALAFVQALHDVDLSGARLKVRNFEGRYYLCFIHAGLSQLSEEMRFGVAATFLDHALGEAVTMSKIGGIEFRPEGEGIEMSLVINQLTRESGGTSDLPAMHRS